MDLKFWALLKYLKKVKQNKIKMLEKVNVFIYNKR